MRDTTAAYAGTNHAADFMIFHDGLSAWWEVEVQAHMATLGFKDPQVNNISANLGTRYEGEIVGAGPARLRRPQGCHLPVRLPHLDLPSRRSPPLQPRHAR